MYLPQTKPNQLEHYSSPTMCNSTCSMLDKIDKMKESFQQEYGIIHESVYYDDTKHSFLSIDYSTRQSRILLQNETLSYLLISYLTHKRQQKEQEHIKIHEISKQFQSATCETKNEEIIHFQEELQRIKTIILELQRTNEFLQKTITNMLTQKQPSINQPNILTLLSTIIFILNSKGQNHRSQILSLKNLQQLASIDRTSLINALNELERLYEQEQAYQTIWTKKAQTYHAELEVLLKEKDKIIFGLKNRMEKVQFEIELKNKELEDLRKQKLLNHKEIGQLQIRLTSLQSHNVFDLKRGKSEQVSQKND